MTRIPLRGSATVRCSELLLVMALHGRAAAAARMPDRQDFEAVPPDAAVQPVANALDMEPPDIRRTGLVDHGADAWLLEQQFGDVVQLLANRTGRGRSIRSPPLDNALDLARCATRDV